MESPWSQCVRMRDLALAYWRKHEDFTSYSLEDGQYILAPDTIVVCLVETAGFDFMAQDYFDERYVDAGNLPPNLRHLVEAMPETYEQWCIEWNNVAADEVHIS